MIIKKIFSKIYKLYYTSSSDRYLKYITRGGVKVGDGTFVLDPKHIQIDMSRPELVEIGKNVFLHRGTIILTHDWASWCFVNSYGEFLPSHGKVKIGDNVWLGENVTILKGVTIGDNVIIGIGSLVTKDIPANSVAVGVPAKVVSTYEDYYKKRQKQYIDECIEYALAIRKTGRDIHIDDFYDDYPCFVDGSNYQNYNYPYHNIFSPAQFEIWKRHHIAKFAGFDEFKQFLENLD